MKNILFILCMVLMYHYTQGQNGGLSIYSELYSQPNPKLNFQLVHRAVESKMLAGQPFCCKIKNLTNNQLKITFNLIALTTCGNEVVGGLDIIILEPNEIVNQCSGFNSVLNNNIVTAKDCIGEEGSYTDSKGAFVKGRNFISSVKIGSLEVTEIFKDTRKPTGPAHLANDNVGASKNSKKVSSDEEKLNAALMKQLEKDFDIEHGKNKEKTLVIEPSKAKPQIETTDNKSKSIYTHKNLSKPGGSRVDNEFKLEKNSVIFEFGRISSGILAEDVSFILDNCNESIISCKKGSLLKFFNADYLDKNTPNWECGLVSECTLSKDCILPVYAFSYSSGRISKMQHYNTDSKITFTLFEHYDFEGDKQNKKYCEACRELVVYDKKYNKE